MNGIENVPKIVSCCGRWIFGTDIKILYFFIIVAFLDIRSPQLNYLLTEDSIVSDLKKLHKLHKGFFSEVVIFFSCISEIFNKTLKHVTQELRQLDSDKTA